MAGHCRLWKSLRNFDGRGNRRTVSKKERMKKPEEVCHECNNASMEQSSHPTQEGCHHDTTAEYKWKNKTSPPLCILKDHYQQQKVTNFD
jgi:hypothetical protein